MQADPAAPGDGIIKRKLQVIVAEEPVESRPCFGSPAALTSYAVSLQARRDRASRFKRLLIKAGFFTALAIETLRTDRHKVAVVFAPLQFEQPIERFEPRGQHTIIRARGTYQQQCLGKSRVSVGYNVLEPSPIRPW